MESGNKLRDPLVRKLRNC
ncbi:hypothetical protein RIR_jg42625.t1 [Rhizophagus irregularis DAOM 181602=DAOM 197198]|nr:hypothetical protein RIR_jg42625.t1 [Rhizophagus irregularis DAOM 181602=DAOM 197198]